PHPFDPARLFYGVVWARRCDRNRGGWVTLDGPPAHAAGLAAVAFAACLHIHFFWGPDARLSRHSGPEMVAAALAFFRALGFVAYWCLFRGLSRACGGRERGHSEPRGRPLRCQKSSFMRTPNSSAVSTGASPGWSTCRSGVRWQPGVIRRL